jgi:hypothetical protein
VKKGARTSGETLPKPIRAIAGLPSASTAAIDTVACRVDLAIKSTRVASSPGRTVNN